MPNLSANGIILPSLQTIGPAERSHDRAKEGNGREQPRFQWQRRIALKAIAAPASTGLPCKGASGAYPLVA